MKTMAIITTMKTHTNCEQFDFLLIESLKHCNCQKSDLNSCDHSNSI